MTAFARPLLSMLFVLMARPATADEPHFMDNIACASLKVRSQIGTPLALDAAHGFDSAAIGAVAAKVPPVLRGALIDTADEVVASLTGERRPAAWTVDAFFDGFLARVSERLPAYFPVAACGGQDLVEDAVYGEAINHYFGKAIGKGALRRWLEDRGIGGGAPAGVAAMVALQLSGRAVDVDAWKDYFVREGRRRAAENPDG